MEGGEGGVMDKDLKDAVEVARYLVSQYKEHTKVHFVASAFIRAATQQTEATPPTTDQRERALEAFQRLKHARENNLKYQDMSVDENTIEAALTATQHVPQETKKYSCDQSEFGCMMFEDKNGGYVRLEDYQSALATLDRVIEGKE